MYGAIDPNASGYMTQLGGDDSCAVNTEWDRYNRELLRAACQERCTSSPIIINFGTGAYRLSGADSPVLFDISNEGHVRRIGWTAAGAEEAFLCLDRNGDGQITNGSELFGNATPLKDGSVADNGFQALAEFDDNHDGVIDSRDSIWTRLLLWTDTNHDGISQGSELTPVSNSPLAGIAAGYHWTGGATPREMYFDTSRTCGYSGVTAPPPLDRSTTSSLFLSRESEREHFHRPHRTRSARAAAIACMHHLRRVVADPDDGVRADLLGAGEHEVEGFVAGFLA